MGTNYYHKGKHLGKRSGLAHGECKFTWAIEPFEMPKPFFRSIVNEYGERFNGNEFESLVQNCIKQDFTCIGKTFF